MKTSFLILPLYILLGIAVNSCKKDNNISATDKELYDLAKETSGFTWYKNSDEFLERSSESGHSQPYLRTRYNPVSDGVTGTDGKVIPGSVFPDGSLIVKELYDNSKTLETYAILYKKYKHQDADENGWVWGYLEADGTVIETASNKGRACIDCHDQDENTDRTLMNKFFP